ncbi:MAG: hypothetical protein Kilf2KO_23560 [Rhodospirillales bacterium]
MEPSALAGDDARETRFFTLAASPSVRLRALRIALIVGPVIGGINHGDKILVGAMAATDWLKFGLTFIVPYSVSTWSSVMALRERLRDEQG